MTTIVGNTYDKFGTKNPIARWLMQGFLAEVLQLSRSTNPQRILEVGCGEGHLIAYLCANLPSATYYAACDLSLSRLDPGHCTRIEFSTASAYQLPYADQSFDLVVCCEVLEHLEDPARALRELGRVSSRYILLSTPREPLWRWLNLARFSYVRSFGNTPGHIQHFSPRKLKALVNQQCNLLKVSLPLPWIVLLTERRGGS